MEILITVPEGTCKETFFTSKEIELFGKIGNVQFNSLNRQFTPEELRERLENIDILVTGWGTVKLDQFVLERADQLKIVAHTGGTVAKIVSDELYEKGIRVLSGNSVFAESVAEGCICYIMCALRRLEKYMKVIRDGGWKDENCYNEGIMGKTIGIVGFGMIAKHFARMLQPFGVNIKIFSAYLTDEEAGKYNACVASLDEIFETCDIISIHAALNQKTVHMIGKNELNRMKDGALIVNTARGAIIDEAALIEELATGRINAVLDVFESEPLEPESKLRGLSNAMLIPHMGGPTIDRRRIVTQTLARDMKRILNHEAEIESEITLDYSKNMTK